MSYAYESESMQQLACKNPRIEKHIRRACYMFMNRKACNSVLKACRYSFHDVLKDIKGIHEDLKEPLRGFMFFPLDLQKAYKMPFEGPSFLYSLLRGPSFPNSLKCVTWRYRMCVLHIEEGAVAMPERRIKTFPLSRFKNKTWWKARKIRGGLKVAKQS